jgi:hypothetical protein
VRNTETGGLKEHPLIEMDTVQDFTIAWTVVNHDMEGGAGIYAQK